MIAPRFDCITSLFFQTLSPFEALRADPQKSNIQPTLCLPRLLSATCLTWSRTQLALFARETQFWELSKQYKIANANTWETLVLLCKKTGSKLIYLESMPHLYWKGKTRKLCKNRWIGNKSRLTFKIQFPKFDWEMKTVLNILILDNVSGMPVDSWTLLSSFSY